MCWDVVKLCLSACCRGRVLCENVVTKGIIIFSASVVVSEVFGVSVVVVRERELKVGWGWGGVVGLKGGLERVLKGGLGGFLKRQFLQEKTNAAFHGI